MKQRPINTSNPSFQELCAYELPPLALPTIPQAALMREYLNWGRLA
jgi:hypothetical protein